MSERETVEPETTGARARHVGAVTRHPSPKEYVRIAIILAVVTALEVAVYYLDAVRDRICIGDVCVRLLIPLLFLFSLIKFTLVVLWFMHLKFDSRTYARFFVMGLAGAITLYLIVLLTLRVFGG